MYWFSTYVWMSNSYINIMHRNVILHFNVLRVVLYHFITYQYNENYVIAFEIAYLFYVCFAFCWLFNPEINSALDNVYCSCKVQSWVFVNGYNGQTLFFALYSNGFCSAVVMSYLVYVLFIICNRLIIVMNGVTLTLIVVSIWALVDLFDLLSVNNAWLWCDENLLIRYVLAVDAMTMY